MPLPTINTLTDLLIETDNHFKDGITPPIDGAMMNLFIKKIIQFSGGSTLPVSGVVNIPGDPLGANGQHYAAGDNFILFVLSLVSQSVPPIVSAGSTQNLNLSTSLSLTLTGTITVGTSAIASTLWVQVSGPVTLTIANPASLTTAVTGFTPGAAGSYQFELKCFTADGAEVDAFVSEVIAYVPPQITSSNQSIQLPTNTGTMSAIVTAGSYAIASQVWSFSGSQSGVSCDSAGNYTLPNTADTYSFTLLVTDVNGHTATATRTVTLTPAAVVVDYMFATSDQYTALQTADTLTYSGHFNLPSTNADWTLDFTSAPANCYPVIRRPSGGTLKNRYTDSGNLTFGTDTFDVDSSSARKFTARGYDYYTWYAPANFTTTTGNTVNISIT